MEIKLSINSDSAVAARQCCRERLEQLFGDHIIGEGDITLAARVLELLRERTPAGSKPRCRSTRPGISCDLGSPAGRRSDTATRLRKRMPS